METSELIKRLGLEGRSPEEQMAGVAAAYAQMEERYTPLAKLTEELEPHGGISGLTSIYNTLLGSYEAQKERIRQLEEEHTQNAEAMRQAAARPVNNNTQNSNYWDGIEYMDEQQKAQHMFKALYTGMQQLVAQREPQVVDALKSDLKGQLDELRNDWQSHRQESDIFQQLIQHKMSNPDVELQDLMQNMAQIAQAKTPELMEMAMKGMSRDKDIESQAAARFEAMKQDFETQQRDNAVHGRIDRAPSSLEAERVLYGDPADNSNANGNPFAPQGISPEQRKASILKHVQDIDDTMTPGHL